MSWQLAPLVLILVLASLTSMSLAVYSWHRRVLPGAEAFAWLMVFVFAWTTGYTIDLVSSGIAAKLFWTKFEISSAAYLPLACLILAIQFSDGESKISSRKIALLSILPTLTLILTWTNEAYHLMWRSYRLLDYGPFSKLDFFYGGWFFVHAGYSYTLIFLAMIFLFRRVFQPPWHFRRQALTLLLGGAIPLVWNALYLLELSPVPHLDLTPFFFSLSGLIFAWGLFRFRLFDLVPLARAAVIENLRDGLVVLDCETRIIDINPVAERIFGRSSGELIGIPAANVFPPASKITDCLHSLAVVKEVVAIGEGENGRHYEVRISPIGDRKGKSTGWLILLGDITPRRRAEIALRRQLEELRVLHAVSKASEEAISEDMLIERATEIIGDTFYPDNFGILMMDEVAGGLRRHASYRDREGEKGPELVRLGEGICGKVGAQGLPIRVRDVRQESQYLEVDPLTLSELCVPLKIGERVIGVINAESERVGAFGESDERLLSTLAVQLSTAIARLRTESAERRHAEQLAIINALARDLAGSQEVHDLYNTIVQSLFSTFGYYNVSIFSVDELARVVVLQAIFRAIGVQPGEYRQAFGKGIIGRVAESGQPVLSNDTRLNPDFFQLEGDTILSELAVPIIVGDRVVGVLNVDGDHLNAFDESDVSMLTTIADQCATTIDRMHLFDETQIRLREVTFLSQIIAITATENDLHTALERVCMELGRFFRVPEVRFALFNSQLTSAQVVAEFSEEGCPKLIGEAIAAVGNPAIAYILETEKYLSIFDSKQVAALSLEEEIEGRPSVKSVLMVPVIYSGEVIGFLEVRDRQRHEFRETQISLAQKVASQIGQVLERLGLFAATREQAERMSHLASLSEVLNRPLSVEEVICAIGEGTMDLAMADRAALYLSLPDGHVTAPWAVGLSKDYLQVAIERYNELPGGGLLQNKLPVAITDLRQVSAEAPVRKLGEEEGYRAVHIWPLVYEDRVEAAVACYYNTAHAPSDTDQEVMLAFARQAAVALQNARLYEEAQRRAAHLEALNAIIHSAASASDLQHLLENALDHTLKAIGLGAGVIWLDDRVVLRDIPVEFLSDRKSVFSGGGIGPRATIAVPDWRQVDAGKPYAGYAKVMKKNGLRATLTTPILLEGRRIGGLAVASAEPRAWLEEELALIEGVGSQLGGAVERIRLLEKIQEHARQVQQIIETVPEGMLLLDENRQIVLANPAAKAYLQVLAGDQADGKLAYLGEVPLDNVLAPAGQGLWQEIEAKGGERRVFELAVQELSSTPEGENPGEPGGWLLVLRDVTSDRENQARIQMQERLATVGQLAAGIAHDFNNIMAAIVVYADLLNRDPNLSMPNRDRLKTINEQVQRAASLIRQILDFSRRSIMERSELDLLPFLKELEKLLNRVMPETIQVSLIYKHGVYAANVDPGRLQQVFMNLAVNARDAMPQGGRIVFELDRLSVLEGEKPPFPELPAGDWVRVSVIDTGEGISPEHLDHVFEPFFTTKPVGEGTGLGLAQAYGIVRQHEGYIDVQSQEGKGTVFHVYLPAIAIRVEEPVQASEDMDAIGAGETVLVVEDDPSTRQALEDLLESFNYRVMTAANGIEALRLFEQQEGEVSLIVSDLVMPKMGGVALYQRLRERCPEVKMLFVTGHPMQDGDRNLLQEGNVHWLQKPFSVKAFSREVLELLDGKEAV